MSGEEGANSDFEVEPDGSGRRRDLARRTLSRLRRGEWPPDAEADLHGLRAGPARTRVREVLLHTRESGGRCVRIVHGRGLHSEEDAVLRERLPEWLSHGPQAEAVLAWVREPRSRGGSTLVLLKRPGRGR